jgi:hypothetical protein
MFIFVFISSSLAPGAAPGVEEYTPKCTLSLCHKRPPKVRDSLGFEEIT